MPRSGRPGRLPARLVASRATLLGALLAAVLVLGGLLATEAWNAARSGAATARRALEVHAAVAAWEFLRGVEGELDDAAGDALAPVIAARAATPFDSLPQPNVLASSFSRALTCPDVERRLVRVDLRDGSLAVYGAPLPPADQRWVADTLLVDAAGFAPGRRDAIVIGSGPQEHLALVYGVKFASFGAPLAAYALVTCPAAFGSPMFERVMARRPLLPDAALAGQSNDSLVALSVRDRHGHLLWQSARASDGPATDYASSATLARLGGLTVHAALRPVAVERLAAEPVPRMRLGVLVALLVVATGLATVALVQLRREQDLARLRADFTSSVSHELRTPLAQIMLFGETLALDRIRDAADRRLAAGTIVSEARRLMHMVDNVLRFAQSERGLTTVTPRPEALAPLVRDTVRAFEPLADSVRFRLELDEDVIAMADAGAVRQVLINLLDNAVKYGPPEQTVTVGVDVQPGAPAFGGGVSAARIRVDDEGTGVPVESRSRVFEPYVRLVRHRGAARGGSGIGLAVVRELAALHGGSAWVETAPNGGARFVLTLPLVVDPAADAAHSADAAAATDVGAPPREQDGMPAAEVHHPERAVRSTS